MASLLFAASYLTYNKIKTKREEKREKKRQAYAQRYSALEREHIRNAEMLSRQHQTGDGNRRTASHSSLQHIEVPSRARNSSESLRSEKVEADGPNAWVDEVIKERSRDGVSWNPARSGEREEKMRHLI